MSTNKNSNRIEVPEAKQALDQFKMEVAGVSVDRRVVGIRQKESGIL